MSQIYNDNTKRPKWKESQLGILGISFREFTHFAGNSAYDLGPKREHYCDNVSVFENLPKKLLYLFPKSSHNFSGSGGKGAVGA